MDECESNAHKQRQKVAMNRERSQRKTMQRVKQRQKLKKSKRMRSVQVFKNLDLIVRNCRHCGLFEAVCIPTWRNYC